MAVRRQSFVASITVCVAAGLTLAGCGSGDPEPKESVYVDGNPTFVPGSTMEKLRVAGKIRIGVKFDQPGMGYREAGSDDDPEGFDVEMAQVIAGKLGIAPDKIQWVETESQNREKFLRNKTVDLVLASYSITPERRELVGIAGPYYVTGQQLLVRKGDKSISGTRDVKGRRVCSARGTTSIERVEEKYHATPVPYGTYTECIEQLLDKSVDAVTTDGALLLGYAAQKPEELKVVGKPFSSERYGVGYHKGDTEMCEFINRTLSHSYRDGTWVNALSRTLWQTSGAVAYPDVDPCPQ
jgi:glutamate transport system substrate-binding protein